MYVGNIFNDQLKTCTLVIFFKLKKEIEKSEIEKKSYKNFFIKSEIILLFELIKMSFNLLNLAQLKHLSFLHMLQFTE